ncbi:hypothetical protein ACP70R_027934 [Stipagrostis hirtigluma subsp. patula]
MSPARKGAHPLVTPPPSRLGVAAGGSRTLQDANNLAAAGSQSQDKVMPSATASEDASQPIGLSASSATTPRLGASPLAERGSVPSGIAASIATSGSVIAVANPDEAIEVEVNGNGGQSQPPAKRQKKLTSEVWLYFDRNKIMAEENGKEVEQVWAQCNFKGCNNKTSRARGESRFGTTGFWTHLNNYHGVVKGQQEVDTDLDPGVAVVEPYKYDEAASLKKLYTAIIMHEYPFNIVEHEYFIDWVKSMRPSFPINCRVTVRKEIMNLYLQEKDKMYAYFKTLKCHLSATMDMWTSNQNKGYMCVTLHWIDNDWKIQKRIINFFHVTGRHTGEKLSDSFTSCLLKWYIEKKMFSLTLDNAAANEVAVKDIVVELKKHAPLICGGLFFHVRCANHILNLVARDGMSVMGSATNNIRAFVLAVKSSTVQWEEFLKCATECGLDTRPGLSLDVSTRWNSTYMMLRDALYYKPAFERLISYERRKYEKTAPSPEEWTKAEVLIPFLKSFYDLTELFSGILYPTANLFFRGFCEIKLQLIQWCDHADPIIREMAKAMTAKFDKYWRKSNVALAVANVLDPRFKRLIVEFYLRKLYKGSYQAELDKFNDVIKKMYQYYVSSTPSSNSEASAPSSAIDVFMNNVAVGAELDSFLNETQSCESDGLPSELEKYFLSPTLKVAKGETFDILSWWKGQTGEYPILSQLARDVLAMQVSTVASESAFSSGGRVIDPFRSRLDPEMVQALICTRDWIGAARKDSRNVSSVVGDLEVLQAIQDNLGLEEEDLASDDDEPEFQL